MRYFAILFIALMPLSAGSVEVLVLLQDQTGFHSAETTPVGELVLRRGCITSVKPDGEPWGKCEDPTSNGMTLDSLALRGVDFWPYAIVKCPNLDYEEVKPYEGKTLLPIYTDTLVFFLGVESHLTIHGKQLRYLDELLDVDIYGTDTTGVEP
ncbi:MAG TPA: hypothetical protein VFI02_14225 [Armatimonadota bacterium]|nr:hypothetical protein [Armatimonadota bacterium]